MLLASRPAARNDAIGWQSECGTNRVDGAALIRRTEAIYYVLVTGRHGTPPFCRISCRFDGMQVSRCSVLLVSDERGTRAARRVLVPNP